MAKKKIKKNHGVKKKVNSSKSALRFLVLSAILLIGFFSFYPALDCGFVNWDDDRNFYENDLITSLNSANFFQNTIKIFQTRVIGNYNPLAIFTFAIEKQLFGLDQPFYWHLNNIILHLISVVLVFFIGRKLQLSLVGASFLALLFAVHPMRVESVVWITERKDVLFASFYFAAMYQYLKQKEDPKKIRWLWIISFFLLSLLSKIQAVSLPITLVLVDYLLDKKITRNSILPKLPLFFISLVFGLAGIYFLDTQGSLESNASFNFIQRICIGSYSFFVYLIKALIPYKLSPLYPYPAVIPWYYYASVLIFPLFFFLCWQGGKRSQKNVLFGLGFFFFNIVFLLQIVGAGQGFLADRFTYVAYFGLFYILAYYFQKSFISNQKSLILGLAGILVCIYSFLSFKQSKIWKNSGTLWTHVLKYSQKSTLPFGNRANYYRDQGLSKLALRDYNSRIALKADDPEPFNSRAKLYFNSSNKDTLHLALQDYSKAIKLAPKEAEYYINRGAAYARLNFMNKAIADFDKGLGLDPDFVNGYLNRSVVYNSIGDLNMALEDALKYLKYKPYSADIWYQAGLLSQGLQNFPASIPYFNKAIKNKSNVAMYFYQRSKSYFMTNNYVQAKEDFYTAQKMGYRVEKEYLEKIERL